MSENIRFRSDIQGLRAIAVVSVVLYHANKGIIPGGYVGVDIFFVISGYLISSILFREIQAGHFSVGQFYKRRIKRIFPALFVMMFCVLVLGAFLLAPGGYRELSRTIVSTVFFLSNYDFMHLSGYFDSASEYKPLLHTWSLSVEEQFYVFFPLLLFFLHKILSARNMAYALVGLAMISLFLSEYYLGTNPQVAYYFTPGRAFELLIGSACAAEAMPKIKNETLQGFLSLLGLALIFVSLFLYTDMLPFPGLAALIPCLGTALVIHAGASRPTLGGKLISFRPFLFFGALSYSLYLWHWPILAYARNWYGMELSGPLTGILLVLAVIAASVSLRYIERPFLAGGTHHLPVIRLGVAAMAVTATAGAVIFISNGLPQRFPPDAQKLFAAKDDFNTQRQHCHGDEDNPIPYRRNCVFGAAGATPDTAVWGDSHGAELAVVIGKRFEAEGRSVMEITSSACPPALQYSSAPRRGCEQHNWDTLQNLIDDTNIKTVILTNYFSAYRNYNLSEMMSGYFKAIDLLKKSGKNVVIVYPIPIQSFDPPSKLGLEKAYGQKITDLGISTTQYASENIDIIQALDKYTAANSLKKVIPETVLCDKNLCRSYRDGIGVLWFNSAHLSLTGANLLLKYIPLIK